MATTRTLPVSGGVITKPALTDTADISVISTDMENIYQEFVSQNNKINHWDAGGNTPDNTDLNDFVTPGIHLLSSSFTYGNMPPDGGAVNILLIAKPSGSTILQFGWGTSNVYYRFRSDATHWQNWRKISATAVT